MQQYQILRIKDFIHMPYIYNNSDLGLAIKGAGVSTSTKPVIRLKNIQKYQAWKQLASVINPSLKDASANTNKRK